MDTTQTASPPRWYWIVAGLALLWMLFGTFALVMDLTTNEAALEGLSEAERQLYAARPTWLFIVYGIAVLGGLVGVIGLLFVMGAIEVVGAAAALPFPLAIFTIGVLLLWLALRSKRRGWLG